MQDDIKQRSKFMSLLLRHSPEEIGLQLDANGWAIVDELIAKSQQTNTPLTRDLIENIVQADDKQRFAFDESKQRIRANQGHSIQVNLEFKPIQPPVILYHGTATRFLDSIFGQGLVKGSRQYVHLSDCLETAVKVGKRHGKVVVLAVDSQAMHQEGHAFYLSENKVWLTDAVPTKFLKRLEC